MATKRINADLEVTGEVIAAGENLNQHLSLLKHLLPSPAQPLNGLAFESAAGGVQNAHLAWEAASVYQYGLNAGDLNAANVIRDPQVRLITLNSDRFDLADAGEMRLFINDILKETLNLTQEGDVNGHLRLAGQALERIEIVPHHGFAPYKRGQMRIYIGVNNCSLRAGANCIRLEHVVNDVLHGSGELTLFYDTGVNPPTISADPAKSLLSAVEPAMPVYLSGVRYLPMGSMLHVKVTAEHIFANCFHAQPVTLYGHQAGFSDRNVDFAPAGSADLTGYSDPPEADQWFVVEKDLSLTLGIFTRDARVSAVARDPFTASTPRDLPRLSGRAILVNTLAPQSTDLREKFTDERYRLPSASFNTIPASITDQWNSAVSLATGEAEVGGSLRYPQTNYTQNFIPQAGQPDYSGRTGDALYCRAFRDLNNPHNSGTLKLAGLTLADIQSGGLVKVELKLPGRTGWLDLGKPFDAGAFSGAEGDGCRTSDASDEFAWTAGIHSTALSGWMIIVRITLKSPASPLLTEMRLIGW